MIEQDKESWHKRWKEGDIDFHQEQINQDLVAYVANETLDNHVLVPLCGKSKDMLWLSQQGFHVLGIELSELAIETFFKEYELKYSVQKHVAGKIYVSDSLSIIQGDFFKLKPTDMRSKINWVYDRACLIALDQNLRQAYANHLNSLCAQGTQMLSISIEKKGDPSGPPYSVLQDEVEHLFSDWQLKNVQGYKKSESLIKKVYHWRKK